jgi:hypothetical protein
MPHALAEVIRRLNSSKRCVACDLDAATRVVEAGVDVLVLAVDGEERHLLVVIRGEDEVRRVAGAATGVGQRALVDLHHVGPAEAAEVADEAVADDAGADDDDLGGLRNRVGGNRVGKDCVGRILAHLNTPVERD